MKLRTVGLIVGLALGIFPVLTADAQKSEKVFRIGVLATTPIPPFESFRQGLRDLGYVEGKHIALEYRWAEQRTDRFPELAAELARLKVDVIVTWGTPVSLAAKNATRTIPIVTAAIGDAVGSGLVASLAHPGGNITGLSALHPELEGKRLELLKEVVPTMSRVAVLWNPENANTALALKETQVAARRLGIQVQPFPARSTAELESAFTAMRKERPDTLIVAPDPFFVLTRTAIIDLAAKSRLPAMYHHRPFVDAGGLMVYTANYDELFRRAAVYVDKILRGARPADLPVEQPTKFELIINLKTAKALGLTIPQSVLIRADEVIQ